jgi:hypothetical protein
MLLGWTRLLDEWVIGLTHYNRSTAKDPVCWEERVRTSSTLADAATRVRSFAYRAADFESTLPLDDATLRFELQGRVYRVAIEQRWPSTPDEMSASAGPWLEQAQARARDAADHDEGERFATADSFIGASRSIRCSGCAFSFPDVRELDRYRYGNDEHPGALLLVQPSIASP